MTELRINSRVRYSAANRTVFNNDAGTVIDLVPKLGTLLVAVKWDSKNPQEQRVTHVSARLLDVIDEDEAA